MGTEFQFCRMERVLRWIMGDGRTDICIHITTDSTLKKIVKFVIFTTIKILGIKGCGEEVGEHGCDWEWGQYRTGGDDAEGGAGGERWAFGGQ